MAKELKLQDPGEGIHEVEIREVLVEEGDEVNEGDPVLVVESDKAAVDIPAPYSGKVASIKVAEGDTANVGDVLMTFGEDEKAAYEPEEEKADETEDEEADEAEREEEEEEEEEEPEAAEPKTKKRDDDEVDEGVAASPVARRAAAERGVDLEAVEPTGPHGRVLREDVEKAAGKKDAALPDFAKWGPVERQKLRSIRRATARHMARSWAEIPHVTHQDVADITELESFRRRHAAEIEEQGGKLTLTAFALKAAVAALKEQPRFNASLDPAAEEIVVKHYHHLGVAVDTEHGLLVPVIRDVDRKSLVDLPIELTQVAEQARAGKLERKAMQGATFTVTNVGALGGTGFAPIVNHPQVAILGLARASWQPVILGDAGPLGDMHEARTVPRLMLPLVLAFDHRVVDGAAAARFVRRLAAMLADVEAFTLVG